MLTLSYFLAHIVLVLGVVAILETIINVWEMMVLKPHLNRNIVFYVALFGLVFASPLALACGAYSLVVRYLDWLNCGKVKRTVR